MMLVGLAGVLRGAGLDVVEVDGWKTRAYDGRPMREITGVTCHHTGSGKGTGVTLGLNTIINGRSDLPGPLAHLYLNREGTFYVVAAGWANHAGVSRKDSYTNPHRIGIEALAAGTGWAQDWPETQMNAYAIGCRALGEAYEFGTGEVLGHKETCAPVGRKVDPSFDMREFRARVARVSIDAIREEANMPSAEEIAKAVWNFKHPLTPSDVAASGEGSDPVGTPTDIDALLRFPPAVARLRREVDADNEARTQQIAKVKQQADRIEGTVNEMKTVLATILERLPAEQPPPAT